LTRNSSSGGGSSDTGLLSQVQLLIIDEVHLLNEDRGAVIEAIVARTFRFQETSGNYVRVLGLSATLPNYGDVAQFLRVNERNTFHFGDEYRPIPLERTFIGIHADSYFQRVSRFNEMCYDKVWESVKAGHQVMVFVHSRADTAKTADALIKMAEEKEQISRFTGPAMEAKGYHESKFQMQKSRNQKVNGLFMKAFGMHHAGLLRQDRNVVEKAFLNGSIRVLCCTATLAWGVNLPARTVIIKGTDIYNAQKGGFDNLGILDVLQIFGRAGRPGLDTQGNATLITGHKTLDHYLRMLTHQAPIQSQFEKNLPNSLNAEIAMGNVTNEKEAADWLQYTYMFVRMYKTPQVYGITQADFEADPTLEKFRRKIIGVAADDIYRAKLIRKDNVKHNANYNSTDLGRVAAKFYCTWQTVATFCSKDKFSVGLHENMDDASVLALFGRATEWEQLKVREDEIHELEAFAASKEICPVPIKGGVENVWGKVATLVQVYLSRQFVESFSLVSDTNYILQNASRLFRCMFEITLTRTASMSKLSDKLLEWCKMVERRIWAPQFGHHTLRHFVYPPTIAQTGDKTLEQRDGGTLKEMIVRKLERGGQKYQYWSLIDFDKPNLTSIVGDRASAGAVHAYLRRIPWLDIEKKVQPITSTIMRISVTLKPSFDWSSRWSGMTEPMIFCIRSPSSCCAQIGSTPRKSRLPSRFVTQLPDRRNTLSGSSQTAGLE